MKFKLIFIASVVLTFFSCKEDKIEPLEGKLPEERISEALLASKQTLLGAENGWRGYLYTSAVGGGYAFYMDFKENNRVEMLSDFNEDTRATTMESTYRLKQVMAPSLIFDTYNYLHLLSDPDPSVAGGNQGEGFGSDYEFEFAETVGDTVKFKGKKRETLFYMVKASAQEKTFFKEGGYANQVNSITTYLKDHPNLYIQDGEAKVAVGLNPSTTSKRFSLTWTNIDGDIFTKGTGFAFSMDGLLLGEAVEYKDWKIVNIVWDASTEKLTAVTKDGKQIEILESDIPVLPLHFYLGVTSNLISVPSSGTLPLKSWSADYVTRRTQFARSIKTGGYNLDLLDMNYLFNDISKTIKLTVLIAQRGTVFSATYGYTYTKTKDGTYKFNDFEATNGNAGLITNDLDPITERMNNDTFTIEIVQDPDVGSVAQFRSKEHPDFYFSGYLQ